MTGALPHNGHQIETRSHTKLSARDRAQLVIAAYESGLISGAHRR